MLVGQIARVVSADLDWGPSGVVVRVVMMLRHGLREYRAFNGADTSNRSGNGRESCENGERDVRRQ